MAALSRAADPVDRLVHRRGLFVDQAVAFAPSVFRRGALYAAFVTASI